MKAKPHSESVAKPEKRSVRAWSLAFMLGAALLAACDRWVPDTIASHPIRDCRDQFCEGDVRPALREGEVAVKVNSRWYAAPAQYFNGYDSRTSFDWWDHRAVVPKLRRPVDMQTAAANGQLQDLAVDIRLSSQSGATSATWRDLDGLRLKGRIAEKRLPRPDLEQWRTKGDSGDRHWFVAASLREPRGAPPTLVCEGPLDRQTICKAELGWSDGVAATVRLRAHHAADWPDIYLEAERILRSLRPV